MKNLAKLVENEVRPMSSGEVLHAPADTMTSDELLLGYCIVQWMQDRLTKRREILNARLKEVVKQIGVATSAGHMRIELEGSTATVEKRVGKAPDEDGVVKLLAKAGIDEDEIYDEVKVKQFNPSKLAKLVELGKIKQADVDLLKKVTYALTVDPSMAVAKQLAEVSEAFEEEKAAVTGETPKKLVETGDPPKKGKGKAAPTP